MKIRYKNSEKYLNMKNLLIGKFTLFLLLALTVMSCSEDFLEETNPNELSTDSFWTNVTDLNLGLVATYKAFSNSNNFSIVDELARTDLAWSSGYQRPFNTNEYYLQTFNEASSTPSKKWAQLYTTIFYANQVIDAYERLTGSLSPNNEEEALEIYAQAKFLRAYMYFILNTSFNNGDVIIMDGIPVEESEFYNNVSSSEDVKAYYRADLEFAMANLPATWEATEKGRATSGAAEAILGQSYLYDNNFEVAAGYFENVINNYGYSLTPNIGSNFTTMDELNEESILEVVRSTDFNSDLNQWDWRDTGATSIQKRLTPIGGWWGAVAANWLIQEYRNDAIDYSDPRNEVYDEDGNFERYRDFSLRTSYSVAIVDDRDLEYYGHVNPAEAANFNVLMTCFWRKHTNWDLGFESEEALSPGKVRSGVNDRLLRLAEIYLQYAECKIEMGDVDEALLYINKVRRRSALQLLGPVGSGEYPLNDHDNLTYDASSLMEHLRYKEYPLELSCEGNGNGRSIDLRRWGVKKQRFQELSERRYDATHYTFTDSEGVNKTKWSSIFVEVDPSSPDADPNVTEFESAALNYQESEHAYWKIPTSELITNPSVGGGDE
ncbi:Starch-binding associating with outer membrane [Lutibacter oricola]|uniref:Starch-binding associating with outer membrane n=1 Tax=Lutibacter oricola TaxID=762486 RepID=A0A1H2Z0T7_9FLAO|nr:RagB/SusD family nutrient uptake outer membrane protein [Lutibacter oricola]SDX10409.1 Starch-binding associating with outer membrane [Lutibacter oricola]